MSEGGSRRAVAEIRFGEDRSSITKVGGRSIHQYWSLLGPHFRDVLLAPQRRSDDGGVAWTWREAADKKPPTAAELAGVRKRLERANESFAENPVNPLMGDDRSGTSSQALIDQVAARVKAMAESLAAKSDPALADFVCRTESGVMIHSWGVASAAQIYYPDALESGVSGVVLAAGKPSAGHEVVIENAQGLSVARMRSDEAGQFGFPKIGPGRYRVRVTSGRVKFPVKGSMVTVERGAMTRLEMQSISSLDDPKENATSASEDSSMATTPSIDPDGPPPNRSGSGWFVKTLGVLLLVLLLVGGGVWAWRTWSASNQAETRVTTLGSSMKPEQYAAGENERALAKRPPVAGSESGGLSASADGVGKVIRQPNLRATLPAGRQATGTPSGGFRRSPATIGSKVEVQSGASEQQASEEGGQGDAAMEPRAAGESATQESILDRGRSTSDSNVGAVKTNHVTDPKTPGTAAAVLPVSDAAPQGGDPQSGASEVVSLENRQLLPSGKNSEGPVSLAPPKKPPARQVQAVSVTGPRPSAEPPQDEVLAAGPAPENAAPPDTEMTEKPSAGPSQPKAPAVKVAIVNKEPPAGKSPHTNEARSAEVTPAGDGEDTLAPQDAAPKRGKNTRATVSPKTAASGPLALGEATSSSPPGPNDPTEMKPTATPNRSKGPENLAADPGGETSPAENSTETGDAASSAAKIESAQGKPVRSAASTDAAARRSGPGKVPMPASNHNQPPGVTQENGATQPVAADPAVAQPKDGRAEAAFEANFKTTTVELTMAAWETRLVRDAIVPTFPVRAGEDDGVEATREKLISEQNARLAETFKHPATRRGFVFELPSAQPGEGPHWAGGVGSAAVERSLSGNFAEVAWADGMPPQGVAGVLLFPDGREAVRVTVQQDGAVSLKLAKGVRGSFWVSVTGAAADETGVDQYDRSPRFGWQVNKTTWQTDRPKSPSRDYRISFPLKSLEAKKKEIALADRVTGWALVTRIQLVNFAQ